MTLTHPDKSSLTLLFTIISMLLLLPENSFSLPSNRVKNLTFDQQAAIETVIVFLEKPPEIYFFLLHNPERIVVDIKEAYVPQVSISQETNGKAIKKVRIGQNKKNTARIVLDISKETPYDFKAVPATVNEKPAVKIMVYPLEKEEEPGTPPTARPSDFKVADHKLSENSLETEVLQISEIQNQETPEQSPALFNTTIPNDIFNQTGKPEEKSDFSISGTFHVRTTLQAKENNAIENNTSFRNRIMVETKYKNLLALSALSDYLYFGSENESDDYDLDLHEAKWQYTDKNYGFSIGKQILRWGKTDQISPVDTLNPQDMREFIIPDYEQRKIPIWMADLNLFFDKFTLEGVFIPMFEKSRLDYFDTNWSLFGHVKKEIQNAPLPPSVKTYVDTLNIHEKDPNTEAELALRVTTTLKEMDLGLTFHHTTEDTPYFKSFPIKNIHVTGDFSAETLTSALNTAILTNENIEVEYKRTNIVGFELETILGDFGVRGEAAWQEKESFITSSLTSTRNPTFIYIAGADYTTQGNTYLNLQFVHRHISNYNPDILYFDQDTYSLLGEIRKDIISDWLEASLKYSKNLNNNEWYLSPQFKYTYITNLECILGAHILSGDKDTWLGSQNDNDLFFLNISYRFK